MIWREYTLFEIPFPSPLLGMFLMTDDSNYLDTVKVSNTS